MRPYRFEYQVRVLPPSDASLTAHRRLILHSREGTVLVQLRLLGPAQLVGSNGQDIDALPRQPKRMALLAYLTIARPLGLHRRDKLLALFWPELDEPHARNALSQALHVIRTALSDDAIVTRGDDEVGIAFGVVRSDVSEFEAALASGREETALLLYRGDLLDGFFVSSAPEFERWLDAERARLRQSASEAGWALARRKAEQGDALEAERYARWAASLLMPDETQLRELMNFLHGLGDKSAAVRAYEDFARKFAEEYDLEPSAATQELATKIRHDSTPTTIGQEGRSRGESNAFTEPAPVQAGSAKSTPILSPRRWRGKSLLILLFVALLGIASTFGIRTYGAGKPNAGPPAPRLVVLPLQNLGSPENGYFAEGVSDEISTRLGMMRGLSVIGGAAARRYKSAESAEQPKEDGKGADYLLEGTASWLPSAGGRGHLRVRLQLVNARDHAELWGAVLEEDINEATELFALYSSIAQRVVNELDVVFQEPPRKVASTIPTTSLEAYNDYLRGRDYLRRTSTPVNFNAAIQTLERAVKRDTTFALAFAVLSQAHTQAVWLGGMSREHLDRAKVAGARALRLDPDLPEGHLWVGTYYYACCEDYERAMWHATKANAIRPGNSQVVMYMGNIHKRQGRWAESIKYYHEAARLDPLARWPQNNLGHSQMWSRSYDDAERTFRRVLASEPQDIFAYAHLAWLLVLRDGDTKAARSIVNEARQSSDGFAEMRIPYYLALLDRNYDEALATLTPPEPGLITSLLNEWLVDDEIRRALVFRLRGDSAAARAQFDSARAELENALRTQSLDSRRPQLWLRSGLAIAYAGLGRRADAIAQVNFVMASDPLKVDAIEGPRYMQHVALADVLLGDRDAAIDVLERLLAVGAPVSPQSLRLEPFWDPLRSELRFAQMIGSKR